MSEVLDIRKLEISDDIDKELATQSAIYMYVAEQAITAEAEYEKLKFKLEEYEVTLDKNIREALEQEGKKTTEKMLENEIKRNKMYQKLRSKLIELRAKRDLLKNLKEAWYMRKDMLVQIAINKRAEMELSGTLVK